MGHPRTLWRRWSDLSSLSHLSNFLPSSESPPTAEHAGQRARTLSDRGVRKAHLPLCTPHPVVPGLMENRMIPSPQGPNDSVVGLQRDRNSAHAFR